MKRINFRSTAILFKKILWPKTTMYQLRLVVAVFAVILKYGFEIHNDDFFFYFFMGTFAHELIDVIDDLKNGLFNS